MHFAKLMTFAATAAVMSTACNRPEPANEPVREERKESAADTAAADLQRKRNEQATELEKRAADIERRWTEMGAKVKEKAAAPTAGLRAEVQEDVQSVRQAVADLKTTSVENWWERHERAMERAAEDMEADVRRFAKGKKPAASPAKPETTAAPGPFESRRDQFVTRMRARIDAMQAQLKDVKARDAEETELVDTRERINKLKDDVDRLEKSSADDWWDISAKRVTEYIDRVERSITRLDDDKK
jgi:hypothetical protein